MKQIKEKQLAVVLLLAFLVGVVGSLPDQALASKFIGTLTFVKGDVEVLKSLSSVTVKEKLKLKKQLQFEGEKYYYKKARLGQKIKPNSVIKCGPKAKAKIVYANGDHFIIGPGSYIRLPASTKKKNKGSGLGVIYGKIRVLISKKGPRNRMKVETKTAVAGVRGTDFYVHDNGVDKFQLTVMRGKVVVNDSERRNEKAHVVKTGHSLKHSYSVGDSTKKRVKPKLYKAPKKELHEILHKSKVKIDAHKKKDLHPDTKKQIAHLEKKAFHSVIEDIKVEDPELHKKIELSGMKDVDQIHAHVVSGLKEKAPGKDPAILEKKRKMTEEELDRLGDGVYKKYYKKDSDN